MKGRFRQKIAEIRSSQPQDWKLRIPAKGAQERGKQLAEHGGPCGSRHAALQRHDENNVQNDIQKDEMTRKTSGVRLSPRARRMLEIML